MRPTDPDQWSTRDEMAALRFMASGKPRGKYRWVPTVSERIEMLRTWLSHVGTRRWDGHVALIQCQHCAEVLLLRLEDREP